MKLDYKYNARVISVYDGDTMRLAIDLGFGMVFSGIDGKGISVRLLGINTPELRGDERGRGIISRDFVRDQVLDKNVIIESYKSKTGKYGRYLVDLYYIDHNNNQIHLNKQLVNLSLAEEKHY